MKIYDIEKENGLEELLSKSVASYVVPAIAEINVDLAQAMESKILIKSGKNDSDLYICHSVLVSTNWNKNDDVFDPKEVWEARHTPEDKPTNLDHDEHQIVGHMIDSWAINDDGNILSDDTNGDNLPNLFHLVSSSVIYKRYSDKELLDRANNLIAQIQNGSKFVSMECLLNNFDYAVQKSDGSHEIIVRGNDTAYLTKHLRAYGGTGEYKGNKVGRLLRDITFCGKGFVDKPANEHSIILRANNKSFDFHTAKTKNQLNLCEEGVCNLQTDTYDNKETLVAYITNFDHIKNVRWEITNSPNTSQEIKVMADTVVNDSTKQIEDLKAELKLARDEAQKLKDDAVQAKATEMQTQVDSFKSQLDESKKTNEELTAQLKVANDKIDEFTKFKADIETKLAKAEQDRVRSDRVAHLVNGGVNKEVAEKKVDAYMIKLTDEEFNSASEDLIARFKIVSENTDADDKILEDAQTDGDVVAASDGDDDDETQGKLVASIQEWAKTQL